MTEPVSGLAWVEQAKLSFAFLQRPEYGFQLQAGSNTNNPYFGYVKYTNQQGVFVGLSGDSRDCIYLELGSNECTEMARADRCVFNLAEVIDWLDHEAFMALGGQVVFGNYPLTLEAMPRQFSQWARLLELYCRPILLGDFTGWNELVKHGQEAVQKWHREEWSKTMPDWRKCMGL
jgi:hypothetical protein